MTSRIKIHESFDARGELQPLFLCFDAGVLTLVGPEEELVLPEGALDAVMARYGGPLDGGARVQEVAALELGAGEGTLQHVRHLAVGDVIARDYLVLARPGAEPVVVLATTAAGALSHLARRAAR